MPEAEPRTRANRWYVYAVGRQALDIPADLLGIEDTALATHEFKGLVLVVSPVQAASLRPQRRHLSAHYRVLTSLSSEHDILPMAFGIIFDDFDEGLATLESNAEILTRQLDATSGCAEMALRLKWEGVDIFSTIIDRHADLRKMRDHCFRNGEPTQKELLALGQAFEQRLNKDRDERLDAVLTVLRPICRDILIQNPGSENISVDIACLVRRSDLAEFDKAVDTLADAFDDNHVLAIDGPQPPFNFVQVKI